MNTPDALLHDRMSFFVNATAVYPPKRSDHGFSLLDVVVIRPSGPPSRMLDATKVNLRSCLTTIQANKFSSATYEAVYGDDERSFKDSAAWSPELAAAVHAYGITASARGARETTHITDLSISDESSRGITGDSGKLIEDFVFENTAKLLGDTALRHYIKRRFVFGVVVKEVRGKISMSFQAKHAASVEVAGGVEGIAEASLTAANPAEEGMETVGEGIIGVQLLCFVVRVKKGAVELSRPIPVVQADENDLGSARKWVRCGRWRVLRIASFIAGRAFRAMQIARKDDPRLGEEERRQLEGVFEAARTALGVENEEIPNHFGGVDGATLWNSNAVRDRRGRKTGPGDDETVFVSGVHVLEDTEVDRALRWREFPVSVEGLE